MLRLLAWLAGTLLLLVLAAGGLLLAGVDRQPLVSRSATISPLAVAQARWLLLTNDPRRLRSGDARQTPIPAALIDEGINYGATRFLHGRGALVLSRDHAEIRLSLPLPGALFFNCTATIREAGGKPRLAAARIGNLPVPVFLIDMAITAGIRYAGYQNEWQLANNAIRELRFEPDRQRLVVSYIWEPALLERARAVAIDPEDLARIRSAHEMLAGLLDHKSATSRIPLPELLTPLLDIAGSDQTANRRAAIFALAAFLSERNLATLIPAASDWPHIRPVAPTLLGRLDSAQHFVISAALAAWAGEPIADAIGLYKELADARHGSGFSFADLAADRAGTTFGEMLVKHPERLDQLLAKHFADTDIAPALNDLPEYLNAQQFQRQFGDTRSPAYRQLTGEIERRIFALPLYRGLEKP